jgi:hypothetical protein
MTTIVQNKADQIRSEGHLGKMTDQKLARKYGIHPNEASVLRRLLGIPRFDRLKKPKPPKADRASLLTRIAQLEDMVLKVAVSNTELLATLRQNGVIK